MEKAMGKIRIRFKSHILVFILLLIELPTPLVCLGVFIKTRSFVLGNPLTRTAAVKRTKTAHSFRRPSKGAISNLCVQQQHKILV